MTKVSLAIICVVGVYIAGCAPSRSSGSYSRTEKRTRPVAQKKEPGRTPVAPRAKEPEGPKGTLVLVMNKIGRINHGPYVRVFSTDGRRGVAMERRTTEGREALYSFEGASSFEVGEGHWSIEVEAAWGYDRVKATTVFEIVEGKRTVVNAQYGQEGGTDGKVIVKVSANEPS